MIFAGKGSPEGVVTAIVGALYLQHDGAVGAQCWQKRSGTAETGWVLVSLLTSGDALPSGTAIASPTLSGTVAGTPAWASAQAITLSTAAQPDITSVGTLTSLTINSELTTLLNTVDFRAGSEAFAPGIAAIGTVSAHDLRFYRGSSWIASVHALGMSFDQNDLRLYMKRAGGGYTRVLQLGTDDNLYLGLIDAGTGDVIIQANGVARMTVGAAGGVTVAGLMTADAGLTVSSGQTLTLTGATVAGAPTWSSAQAITLSTAAQPNVTSLGTLTGLLVADGSAGTPVIRFASDPDTGVYSASANALAIAAGGAAIASFELSGTRRSIVTTLDGDAANLPLCGTTRAEGMYFDPVNPEGVVLVAGGNICIRAHDTGAAGNVKLQVWDVTAAALRQVSIGAAESGGAGFRLLRIPN